MKSNSPVNCDGMCDDYFICPRPGKRHKADDSFVNKAFFLFIKRLFDICFSLLVIIFGFIPGLFLSIIIMIDTKGSPIYTQERIGKNGKIFKIYKFRTMVADSDNVEKYLTPDQLKVWERERKVDDDPRITQLGKILRALSIDEFPQFINVLLSQISVIGPRAITSDEIENFGDYADVLLSVSPGITGLWQVSDRNNATFENGLRQKIELFYARNASLKMDKKIFLATFSTMFIKKTGK